RRDARPEGDRVALLDDRRPVQQVLRLDEVIYTRWIELHRPADEIHVRALVTETTGRHDPENLVRKRRRDPVAKQACGTGNDLNACGVDVLKTEIPGAQALHRVLGGCLVGIPAVDRA